MTENRARVVAQPGTAFTSMSKTVGSTPGRGKKNGGEEGKGEKIKY